MSEVLDNPVWHALGGAHREFVIERSRARRYHPDVSPFAAVDAFDSESWADLGALAREHGPVAVFRDVVPPAVGWEVLGVGTGVQLVLDSAAPVTTASVPLRRLGPGDVAEMLALVELTQPGPFRPRTIELGTYVGHFDDGRLVAMAGERLRVDGYTEVSAVCTHPEATGRGLGAALTQHVAAGIRARAQTPFLHSAAGNGRALALYERLGFVQTRNVEFSLLQPTREG